MDDLGDEPLPARSRIALGLGQWLVYLILVHALIAIIWRVRGG